MSEQPSECFDKHTVDCKYYVDKISLQADILNWAHFMSETSSFVSAWRAR